MVGMCIDGLDVMQRAGFCAEGRGKFSLHMSENQKIMNRHFYAQSRPIFIFMPTLRNYCACKKSLISPFMNDTTMAIKLVFVMHTFCDF
jgi:hypothetical protein